MKKHIQTTAEWDYDFKHDILCFKGKDRIYKKSIEFENIVLDVDDQDIITGLQIFEASKFLKTTKFSLKDIHKGRFESILTGSHLEVRFSFEVVIRNKVIEKNPIIVQSINGTFPESRLVCEMG